MNHPTEELNAYLADLAGSGAALPDGLRAAAKETRFSRSRRRMLELAERIENGESLKEVLSNEDSPTGDFTSTAILSGLTTRDLSNTLHDIADFESKRQSLRRRFWMSMSYPLMLTAMAFILLGLLSRLPGVDIAREWGFGEEYDFSIFIRSFSYNISLSIAGLVVVLILLRLFLGAARMRWLAGCVPVFGSLLQVSTAWEFSVRLKILLERNTRVDQALNVISKETSDSNLGELCQRLAHGVGRGRSLGQQLRGTTRVPETFNCLVDWGESNNALVEALEVASEVFEGRIRLKHELIRTVMPPVIYILIGTLAVGIGIAVIFPLVQLIRWL